MSELPRSVSSLKSLSLTALSSQKSPLPTLISQQSLPLPVWRETWLSPRTPKHLQPSSVAASFLSSTIPHGARRWYGCSSCSSSHLQTTLPVLLSPKAALKLLPSAFPSLQPSLPWLSLCSWSLPHISPWFQHQVYSLSLLQSPAIILVVFSTYMKGPPSITASSFLNLFNSSDRLALPGSPTKILCQRQCCHSQHSHQHHTG